MMPSDALTRQPAHVLVVQPDAADEEVFYHLSENMDAKILVAHTSLDAVELAGTCTELRVAVILWDAGEPGCLDLIEKLRALHPDVGIVLVSAAAGEDAVRRAVQTEVDEFVSAPVEPGYLREVVHEMLAGHDLHWSPIY